MVKVLGWLRDGYVLAIFMLIRLDILNWPFWIDALTSFAVLTIVIDLALIVFKSRQATAEEKRKIE